MAKSITVTELKKCLDQKQPVELLDVRRRADYEASPEKITTALRRDPERVDEWGQGLPRDRPTIVYCAKGGSVSQSIANQLHEKHNEVLFLEGGIKAWIENGYPVE